MMMEIRIRLAGALIGVALIAGCSQPSGPSAAPVAAADAESKARDLDAYLERDLAFFDRFKLENAITMPPPASIEVAARQSTAVVVAEVADVQIGQVVVGDGQHDRFSKVAVVLRTVEVLKGALRPELNGRVVVEFMVPDGDGAAAVASLRAGLPSGKSVWFLHWLGNPPTGASVKAGAPPRPARDQQLYGLISMQGLFVQGSGRVIAAVAEEEHGPGPDMASDGARFAKLSELVAHVRALK